ncbi:MAG TPA: LysR substrate-binding domain-containing protein [Steroidobacteraceae bacterium]|nr:LysR substrate-binding domain-containing protein [Steroidobacteraceae bacterium]
MTLPNLDLDTIRTLVLAKDLGGYGQAGKRLGRTPSAISLQMKRLQELVGTALFQKEGRSLGLTEAGEMVLAYGRRMLALNDEVLDTVRGATLSGRVRLGFSQDFAENVLPTVLSRFTQLYPLVLIELRIEGNAAMAAAVEQGELDIALTVGAAERALAERLGELQLMWIAGDQFQPRNDQPLPLVMLGPQCVFRKIAIEMLERGSHPWRLAAVSPSLAGLWASAMGGLGVTARSGLSLPGGLARGKTLFGLPALPRLPVALHVHPGTQSSDVAREVAARLCELIREALTETLSTRQNE